MSTSQPAVVSQCPIRGRLAGVKRSLFNPDLPTLRRMQRDDTMCKLPEEHCRHTTRCTAEQFASAHNRPFRLPDRNLPCLGTVTGRGITSHYDTLEDLQEAHKQWSKYLTKKSNNSGSFQQNLSKFCNKLSNDDWHFDGVMLRVTKPEIRDWRYTFKCEPGLDQSGKTQRVTPSDIYDNRHRQMAPIYNYCKGTACNRR